MDDEIESFRQKNVWSLTSLPVNKRPIDSKWVFKIKMDSEGKITKYIARLVAKGFNQTYGEDYDTIFAPVLKQNTFRILLSIAAVNKLCVRHFDVKTAFLNGNLNEELYMLQPEGYVESAPHLVYRLHKSVYGLKQAARAWNATLTEILKKFSFVQSQNDPCLFTNNDGEGCIYLLIYVDDIIICHKKEDVITKLGENLNKHFEIVDLKEISYFLGIRVQRTHNGSFLLDQEKKIHNLIDDFGLNDSAPVSIPMNPDYPKLSKEEGYLSNNEKYAKAVRVLLYLSTTTRPDIATGVGYLTRKTSQPRQMDWDAAKRMIRYLKGTSYFKLKIRSDVNMIFTTYADADWAGDIADRKSVSGFVLFLGENPIYWSSKKQTSVSLSSTEAEYIAAASASQEIIWTRRILVDFGLKCDEATCVFEDNQGCIKLATNEKVSCRSKHIDVKYHHLRDLVTSGVIEFAYCQSEDMIADGLTKPLTKEKFWKFKRQLGLVEE